MNNETMQKRFISSTKNFTFDGVITRQEAEWLLANCNAHNRPLQQAKVNKYAKDMALGLWKGSYSSAPIAINPEGQIKEGQHRLHAFLMTQLQEFHTSIEVGSTRSDVVQFTELKRTSSDQLIMSLKSTYPQQGLTKVVDSDSAVYRDFALKINNPAFDSRIIGSSMSIEDAVAFANDTTKSELLFKMYKDWKDFLADGLSLVKNFLDKKNSRLARNAFAALYIKYGLNVAKNVVSATFANSQALGKTGVTAFAIYSKLMGRRGNPLSPTMVDIAVMKVVEILGANAKDVEPSKGKAYNREIPAKHLQDEVKKIIND